MRFFAFAASISLASAQSYVKHNVDNPPVGPAFSPYTTNWTYILTCKTIWSREWPRDVMVQGEVIVASVYVPQLLGFITVKPAGADVCDVRTFHTMTVSETAGMIAFNTQMEMWQCSAHSKGGKDITFLDHYYEAGFTGMIMYMPSQVHWNAQFAAQPLIHQLYWKSRLYITAIGPKQSTDTSPPDALYAMFWMAATLMPGSTVKNYAMLQPDYAHLATPAVLNSSRFLAAVNVCFMVFAILVITKLPSKMSLAFLCVVSEGVFASGLRCVKLIIFFPDNFRSSPMEYTYFLTPGVDTVASLMSSVFLSGIYGRVALGPLGSRKSVIWFVNAFVAATVIGFTIGFLYLMTLWKNAVDLDPPIVGGWIPPVDAANTMVNYNKYYGNLKNVGVGLAAAILAIFVLLTIVVAVRVVQAMKLATSAAGQAKHMLQWMIPNICMLVPYTVFLFIACGDDLDYAIGTESVVLTTGYGMQITGLLAGFFQVGVFYKDTSSSSSASSSSS